jgi:hypothetical protein
MPSGDAQRVWFPEMLEALKKQWHKGLSWEEVGVLCDQMQEMRDQIRQNRNIKPVRMFCKKCGKYSLTTPGRISMRSLLFALKKVEIVTEDKLKELDKSWKKYRKTQNLDPYGKKVIIPDSGKKQT